MKNIKCRACSSESFKRMKCSDVSEPLKPENFMITDHHYGRTGALDQCLGCGLLQCFEIQDIAVYYESLTDLEYESSRQERLLQEKALVKKIQNYRKTGRWFDVGAASGAMVEASQALGFEAMGIEPSRWLQQKARERGFNIVCGVLPHPDVLEGGFDVVSLVDVIEHVEEPYTLLLEATKKAAPNGVIVIVTPNVRSLVARILGWKWWHYRIAHVTYFDINTLDALAKKCGLVRIGYSRPGWVFDMTYLVKRFAGYFYKGTVKLPSFFSRIKMSINFFDSMMCVYEKRDCE